MSYQLYTDATADFCPEMAAPYAEIKVIPMELTVERSLTPTAREEISR
ncbi:MAG: hypothetical protein ACLR2E_05200 [Lachnospiraceae bacterium]